MQKAMSLPCQKKQRHDVVATHTNEKEVTIMSLTKRFECLKAKEENLFKNTVNKAILTESGCTPPFDETHQLLIDCQILRPLKKCTKSILLILPLLMTSLSSQMIKSAEPN